MTLWATAAFLVILVAACSGPDYLELTPSYTRLSPGDSSFQDDRSPRSWTGSEEDGHAVGAAVTFGWHLGHEGRPGWDDPTPPVEPVGEPLPILAIQGPPPVMEPVEFGTAPQGAAWYMVALHNVSEVLVVAFGSKAAWTRRKDMGQWVKDKIGRGENRSPG